MAQFIKHFVQDLQQDIRIRQCGTIVFNKDNESNVISVDLYNGTEQYSGGGTVAGAVICPDGATVALTGTLSGNTASVTLTGDCFSIPGQIGVGVQVVSGSTRTTVLKAIYNVELVSTDDVVDPDSRLTASVAQLVSDIETATADIPASDMASLMSGIAPVFSATTNYAAGAYVYYSGTLYRFTNAHAAGSWTGTDATQVDLGNDLGSQVSNLKSAFDSITAIGENKFNKETVIPCKRLNADGTESTMSAGYHSDFISVVPETTLYVAHGLGSTKYITCGFFDENKNLVPSANVTRGTTDAFSMTVPIDCYYMVLNGSNANIDGMYVYTSDVSGYKPYQLYPNGHTGNALRLYSAGRMYYNNGTLFSQANIRLTTYDKSYNLGKTINVGAGIWLFWNNSTHTLFASNNYETELDENIYFVSGIGVLQPYSGDDGFMAVLGFSPLVELDLANNKLYYKSEDNAYVYAHSARHTIAAQTAEFNMTNYTVFYYDIADSTLKVTNDYDENASSRVVILERLGPSIKSITPYILITNENANVGKKCVCYGDSLTYYDKKNFTWGPQQGTKCVGYESYLESYNGMDVANRGQSGKTTPQICENLKSASDLATFDYLILMGGNNDDRLEVGLGTVQPVGGTFDTTTVAGALQSAIEYALTQNPALRIILMTEPMGWTYEDNTLKRVSELIPNTYRNVAKQYGLPLIDLWEKSGVNELTRNNYYLDPPDTENTLYMYHPNNTGWRQISKIICNEIKQY